MKTPHKLTDQQKALLAAEFPSRVAELPEFVDTADLAVLTGTPPPTWRYWIHADEMPDGFPPSFKLGRRRVWRKAAVLAWLAEQEKAASAGVA